MLDICNKHTVFVELLSQLKRIKETKKRKREEGSAVVSAVKNVPDKTYPLKNSVKSNNQNDATEKKRTSSSKFSSLFKNNPEIPQIPRLVYTPHHFCVMIIWF